MLDTQTTNSHRSIRHAAAVVVARELAARGAADGEAAGGRWSLSGPEADYRVGSSRDVEGSHRAVRRSRVGARFRTLVAPARVRPFLRVPDHCRGHKPRAAAKSRVERGKTAVTHDKRTWIVVISQQRARQPKSVG